MNRVRSPRASAIVWLYWADGHSMTPLSYFLQTSMLSSFTEGSKEEKDTPKVTITTVHAAKGLEWPVVFIPAGEFDLNHGLLCLLILRQLNKGRILRIAVPRHTRSQRRDAYFT
ncbi:hypothetical protein BCR39DRAFT_547799 [Naematelia encephala]|uniref:UvrD-like helicase C-terminal domain-containing protein n=1 Tax=Naematelia encephala TaxID=71784 RepID=A0A1Y2AN86_9TREE|nr:hypothetical protein BCR39DRAFT_547799 [Naematelia encephala]